MFLNLENKRSWTKDKSSIFVCDQGMNCPHCGNSGLQDIHSFCFKCGAKIILPTEIDHERTSEGITLNAKHEKTDSFVKEGNGLPEINVVRDESGKLYNIGFLKELN